MQRFLKIPVVTVALAVLALAAGVWWWHARSGSQLSFLTAVVKRGDVCGHHQCQRHDRAQ